MSLVCNKCGAIDLGFATEGDRCFGKRCGGLFVLMPTAAVAVERKPVQVNGHNGCVAVVEAVPEVVVEPPPALDPMPEVELLPEEAPAEGKLADRKKAVALARELLERRKAGQVPTEAEIAELRALFYDLGSVHRPERGFPDMAKAKEKHKGQFFTSPVVGELMWRILRPPVRANVLESCLGSANLIAHPDQCFVTGIDVDREAVLVSRAILGPGHCVIADELQHHRFQGEFEVVLGNPPYSVSMRDRRHLWGHSVGWDGWGRGELVWLEQTAMAVKKGGCAAAVLPVGMCEVMTPKFAEWLNTRLTLAAEIVLPNKEAHTFSQWPVSLYLWAAGDWPLPTKNLVCESLRDWMDALEEIRIHGGSIGQYSGWKRELAELWREFGQRASLLKDDLLDTAIVIKPWEKPRVEQKEADLPLVEEDVVLVRVINGKLRLVPNGLGAQAKMEVLRLEMGERYDRKQEAHFWKWNELVASPALLCVGTVVRMLHQYSIRVEVDKPAKAWLKNRYRWWKRQMCKIPRWVNGAAMKKEADGRHNRA